MSTDKSRLFYVYRIALVASVGGFLFGFDLVIISGALLYLEQYFNLSPSMKGFVVSSAILGAISGPLIGLWVTDRLGRRRTMMLATAFFAISTLGCAVTDDVWSLCFWRFMGGIGVGLAMMSSPIYIAELAPPEQRGRLVNVNQLSNVFGINMAVIVSYFFSFEGNWRLMFASQGVPVLILFIGLLLIPESPRWLMLNGFAEQAKKILIRVNGPETGMKELKEIENSLVQTQSRENLFTPPFRTALITGTLLMILSQVNGVNMMLLYAPTILSEAGIGLGTHAILSSIPIYLFIFICTLLAFPLIKHFSRRGLLIGSVIAMGAGHVLMALILMADLPPLYILIPMLVATGAFTLGLAPLSWIIISELFPNRIRGRAMGIVCFFLYLSSFLIAQIFPVLGDWFAEQFENPGGMYLLFTAICWGGALFCWKMIPETKNLKLEDVDHVWAK